jgi:hypothetical protein
MARETGLAGDARPTGKIVTGEHNDRPFTIGLVELTGQLSTDVRWHLRVEQDHVVMGAAPMRLAKLLTRLRRAAAKRYRCSGTIEHLTDRRTARRIIVY